jgi:hypothetical protein
MPSTPLPKYKNSPLLQRVAELPIFGDKAKNAQTYGACLARLLSIPPALTTRLQFQQASKPI